MSRHTAAPNPLGVDPDDPDNDPSAEELLTRLADLLKGEFEVAETYSIVTPESAEDGDYADSGYEYGPEVVDLEELLNLLPDYVEHFSGRWWSLGSEEDYRTGESKSKDFHVSRPGHKDLSSEEYWAIDQLIKNRQLKRRLEEYLYDLSQQAPGANQAAPAPAPVRTAPPSPDRAKLIEDLAQQAANSPNLIPINDYGLTDAEKDQWRELVEKYRSRKLWARLKRKVAQVAIDCREMDDSELLYLVDLVGTPDDCDTPSKFFDDEGRLDSDDYKARIEPFAKAFTDAVSAAVNKWIAANNPSQEVVDVLTQYFESDAGGFDTWLTTAGHGAGMHDRLDPDYGDYKGTPGFDKTTFNDDDFIDKVTHNHAVQRAYYDLENELNNAVYDLCGEGDEDEDDEDGDEFDATEPDEDDYIIAPARGGKYSLSHEGKHLGTFPTWEDAARAAGEDMDQNQVWSNIWEQDDHGGWTPIELEEEDDDEEAPDDEEETPLAPTGAGPGEYYIDASMPGAIDVCRAGSWTEGGRIIDQSFKTLEEAMNAARGIGINQRDIWVAESGGRWSKYPMTAPAAPSPPSRGTSPAPAAPQDRTKLIDQLAEQAAKSNELIPITDYGLSPQEMDLWRKKVEQWRNKIRFGHRGLWAKLAAMVNAATGTRQNRSGISIPVSDELKAHAQALNGAGPNTHAIGGTNGRVDIQVMDAAQKEMTDYATSSKDQKLMDIAWDAYKEISNSIDAVLERIRNQEIFGLGGGELDNSKPWSTEPDDYGGIVDYAEWYEGVPENSGIDEEDGYAYRTIIKDLSIGGPPQTMTDPDGTEWELVTTFGPGGEPECWFCSEDNDDRPPDDEECPICENPIADAPNVIGGGEYLYEVIYRTALEQEEDEDGEGPAPGEYFIYASSKFYRVYQLDESGAGWENVPSCGKAASLDEAKDDYRRAAGSDETHVWVYDDNVKEWQLLPLDDDGGEGEGEDDDGEDEGGDDEGEAGGVDMARIVEKARQDVQKPAVSEQWDPTIDGREMTPEEKDAYREALRDAIVWWDMNKPYQPKTMFPKKGPPGRRPSTPPQAPPASAVSKPPLGRVGPPSNDRSGPGKIWSRLAKRLRRAA